jgi:hypothetical protein
MMLGVGQKKNDKKKQLRNIENIWNQFDNKNHRFGMQLRMDLQNWD